MIDALDLTTVLLLLIAGGMAVASWYLARSWPRVIVAVWAAVCFLVPIWVGAQAGLYFSVLTAIMLIALAAWSVSSLAVSIVDVLVLGFALLVLAAFLFGGSTWGHVLIVFLGWFVPYAWGRAVMTRVEPAWLYSCIAVGATAAGLLGIIEFLTGFNPFVQIAMPNSAWRTWHELQPRAEFLRVEGAFGHSIAYGSALAIGSVFVIVARWPVWPRLVCLSVIVVAVVLSFSRIALLGLAVSLVLALLLLGRWTATSMRIAVSSALVVAAVIAAPMLRKVFAAAGEEAGNSAEYRSDLVALFSEMRLLGIASTWTVLPSGETYYGSFRSIDSELVLTGLRFGLLPLLALLGGILALLVSILRNRVTPASIALVAQLPALATVALITQYGYLVWFVAGLAVTSAARDRPDRMLLPTHDAVIVTGVERERSGIR